MSVLDPYTAAPIAIVETTYAPEWNTVVGERTWQTQAEAEAACMTSNVALACARIREAAADPALLANRQFTEELDSVIAYLARVPEIVAGRVEDERPELMRELGILRPLGDDERAGLALIAEVAGPMDLEASVTNLRDAMALLPDRPPPQIDHAQVAMLEWIRREVAPRRADGAIKEAEIPGLTPESTFTEKLQAVLALDEGDDDAPLFTTEIPT